MISHAPSTAVGVAAPAVSPRLPSASSRAWRAFPYGLALAWAFLVVLLLAAVAPQWLVGGDPLEASARHAFTGPSSAFFLGTDENGRDVWTRLVHGARPSLIMGLAATVISVVIGVVLGLLAGLSPRWVDAAVMRAVDVLLAFPDLLLALVIITFWGQGMLNTVLAIGFASVPRYARLVRAHTQTVRRSSYVEAAKVQGQHPLRILWRHVLPNSIRPILLLAALGVGGKIAAGASLSFLGFGAPPPSPEWGSMLSVGRNYLGNAWWLTAFPGIAITLTVLCLTAVSRDLMRRSEGRAR